MFVFVSIVFLAILSAVFLPKSAKSFPHCYFTEASIFDITYDGPAVTPESVYSLPAKVTKPNVHKVSYSPLSTSSFILPFELKKENKNTWSKES